MVAMLKASCSWCFVGIHSALFTAREAEREAAMQKNLLRIQEAPTKEGSRLVAAGKEEAVREQQPSVLNRRIAENYQIALVWRISYITYVHLM